MNTLPPGLTEQSAWRLHSHRHEHSRRHGRGVDNADTSTANNDVANSTGNVQTAAPAKPTSSVMATLQSVTDAVMKIAERFLSGNQTLSVAPSSANAANATPTSDGTATNDAASDAGSAAQPTDGTTTTPAPTGATLSAESESLKLKIKGFIRTEDGSLIRFKVSLNIRHEAVQFAPGQAAGGGQDVDGVQVNSDQPAASFSSTRIQFDLKARVMFGQSAPVNAGSGELAVGDAANEAPATGTTAPADPSATPASTPTETAQTPASTSYPELMFFRLRLSMTQSSLQLSWPAPTATQPQLPAATTEPTTDTAAPAASTALPA